MNFKLKKNSYVVSVMTRGFPEQHVYWAYFSRTTFVEDLRYKNHCQRQTNSQNELCVYLKIAFPEKKTTKKQEQKQKQKWKTA